MSRILDYIAEETGGKPYKSHRFCYDAEVNLPSLAYDESREFTVRKDKIGETDNTLKIKNLSAAAKICQKEKPLFNYFLDGSRRIYKVDDIEYGKRLFPVVGGQIGVACCRRNAPDDFGKAILENHLVLSLPSFAVAGQKHSTQFLARLTKQINETARLKRLEIKFNEILTYSSDKADKDSKEYLDRGTATVQDKMIECEKRVVAELVKKNLLHQDSYLIKDGSLQYSKTASGDFRELAVYQSNYRRVVGVSKSFNPEFSVDRRGQSNAAQIAGLPLYHRTPAAMYAPLLEDNQRIGKSRFSIWYVRVHEAKYSESPFAGVLKLEKVLTTEEEIENGLDSGEVDRITANIINERNPVGYGKDGRWANHLYPIYLTENYIKSKFLSDLHFINLF